MTENCNKNLDVLVIGAGIAGATVAYACARRGLSVHVLEKHSHAAAEASGNPAGILYPFMARKWDAATSFYLQGFAHTVSLLAMLDKPGAWHGLTGMLHLPKKQHDMQEWTRLQELANSLGLDESVMRSDRQGFFMPRSGWVNVPAFCAALLHHPRIDCHFNVEVATVKRSGQGWVVHTGHGEIWHTQHVVIATAYAANQLFPTPLHMHCIRGQITYLPAHYIQHPIPHVYCYGGYITPAINGIHYVGATFEKERNDTEVDVDGHRQNLDLLRVHFPELIVHDLPFAELQGRAALRTVSADRLPIIGRAHDAGNTIFPDLFLSLAHGARGLVSAPLAGEMLAQHIMQSSVDVVSKNVAASFAPERFFLRKQQKNR